MIAKTVPTIMKNQRPTMLWRIWRLPGGVGQAVAVDRRLLLAERLGQQHAADAERLLRDGGHVGEALLGVGADRRRTLPTR